MIYSQIMSLNPRERTGFHPSGHPPPVLPPPPVLFGFLLVLSSNLLSYDIRDEIIELIEDMDSQIVVDTSVYKNEPTLGNY